MKSVFSIYMILIAIKSIQKLQKKHARIILLINCD